MQKTPEQKTGEDVLPISPYAIHNIGGGQPENFIFFVQILLKELDCAGLLLDECDFESHKQLVSMQRGRGLLRTRMLVRLNVILGLRRRLR